MFLIRLLPLCPRGKLQRFPHASPASVILNESGTAACDAPPREEEYFMLDSISPYALLQASKPKGIPTVTTAYDCYSALQSCPPSAQQEEPAPPPQEEAVREPVREASAMPLVPRSRTHYIEQIRSRHSAAARRAYPTV